MIKKEFLRLSRYLIFLAVFNALFFVLGGSEHNVSVWISYGFIHFALLMLMITSRLLARRGESEAVFKWTLYSISLIYFLVSLVIGVIFILIASEECKVAFLLQFSIAGVYGILMATFMLANEWTADAEKERKIQIAFVKDASAIIKGCLDRINDKTVKKKVERVYDALCSSPVKTHPDLSIAEDRILRSIRALESAIVDGSCEEIIPLAGSLELEIGERNRQLKAYN